MEAFLDGASLGKLTAPNVMDFQNSPVTSPPSYANQLYSFDVAMADLNASGDTLRVVVTDTSGFQADNSWQIVRGFDRTENLRAVDPSPTP